MSIEGKTKKAIIYTTTLAMLTAAVGGFSYISINANEPKSNKSTSTDAYKRPDEGDALASRISSSLKAEDKNAFKNETVYAFADPSGKINKVLVNEHLNNKEAKEELIDETDLTDIVNLKGDETFEIEGNKIKWKAEGKDIYYQGQSTKELPVELNISYSLNGKKIDVADLIGQSGRVTIRFDYKNNTSVNKEINGKKENIKIPFVAISGVMLDDSFKNVEVVNGKLLSEGKKDIVLGYALPGLIDSIGVSKEEFDKDFEIPDYFEFSADVENFKMGMSVTMIANGSNIVVDNGINLDSMDNLMNSLSDAGNRLSDGSKELTNGISTLNSKMSEFDAGMGQLKSGIDALAEGSNSLADGIYAVNNSAASIANGISNLDAALNTPMSSDEKAAVAASAQSAVEGAFAPGSETYNYIYGTASSQFAESMTNEQTINMIYQGLYANLHDSLYGAGVANGLQMALEQGLPVTKEDIIASQGGAIEEQIQSSLYELAAGIANGIAENGKDSMGASVVEACKNAAVTSAGEAAVAGAEGTKSTIAGKIEAQQENGYSLVTGSQALAGGTAQLANGVPTLTEGINGLSQGASTLLDGSSQLLNGTSQLLNGSAQLEAGINTFNNDAVNKMVTAYNGDVKTFVERLDAVVEASSEYDTYTMLENGATGTTKIIIKTTEIK
ncbi:MAG: hypothetical protein PUG10_07385 [Lachnospiraceae bacterium]|nr:hypothetical protein [Lachnospiraceae bacterium]